MTDPPEHFGVNCRQQGPMESSTLAKRLVAFIRCRLGAPRLLYVAAVPGPSLPKPRHTASGTQSRRSLGPSYSWDDLRRTSSSDGHPR